MRGCPGSVRWRLGGWGPIRASAGRGRNCVRVGANSVYDFPVIWEDVGGRSLADSSVDGLGRTH